MSFKYNRSMETFETGKYSIAQNAYVYCLDQLCVLSEGMIVISDYDIINEKFNICKVTEAYLQPSRTFLMEMFRDNSLRLSTVR